MSRVLALLRVLAALGLLGFAAAALLYVLQLRPYWEAQYQLDVAMAKSQKRIQQGLIMEAQLPEFRKEVEKLAAKLEVLDRILPADIAPSQYQNLVRERARLDGLPLDFLGEPRELVREDGVRIRELDAWIGGPTADAEEFLGQLCGQVPLNVVASVEQDGACLRALIVLYGRGWSPPAPEAGACEPGGMPEPSTFLLPPLPGWLAESRRQLEEACAEEERLRSIIAEVIVFQRDKQESERRIATIDRLVADAQKSAWCGPRN